MRRFAAAAISAAALTTGLVAFGGTANAAAGHGTTNPGGDGGVTALHANAAATGKVVKGKVHKFTVPSVHGAKVWGDWYWEKDATHGSFVVLDWYIKDTAADGKSAGLCYDLTSPKVHFKDLCLVSRYGYGKTDHITWTMGFWNQDHLRARTAVGRLDKQAHIFYTSAMGSWRVIR